MDEVALVTAVALLGWLFLIWRSRPLDGVARNRSLAWVAIWLAVFASVALFFRAIG